MTFLLVSFFWFFVSIVLHVLANKMRLVLSVSRKLLMGVFVLGLVGYIVTIQSPPTHIESALSLPLTGIFLYIALTLAYGSITASPSLGDESPTSKIVLLLFRKGPQTEKQIFSEFTHHEVLGKRIRNLLQTKWVTNNKGVLKATKQGRLIGKIFLLYRNVLGISEGG